MKSTLTKTVCITGCSTGFGKITAVHLARRGWRVFATVRKAGDQQKLLDECGDHIVPVICDITNTDDVTELQCIVRGGGGGDWTP